MKDIGSFLSLLKRVKTAGANQWVADCPCLTHKTPAKHLSIGLKDNKILLTCFGSDTAEDIVKTLGLELSDLFIKPEEKLSPTVVQEKIVAEYDYQDEAGNFLFQVVRYEPKEFRQRHKNGSGHWVWNMDGVRRVLYHLPEILGHDGTIYLVEGEKDTDNLWKWGQVATTSPGGASSWKPEYSYPLTGKKVVIIPDNDPAGMAYAKAVAKSLQGKTQSTRCILLQNAKDITDWLEQDNDIADLPTLEQDISVLWTPEIPQYQRDGAIIQWLKDDYLYQAQNITRERTGVHARLSISTECQPLAWTVCNIDRSEERVRLSNQVKKNDETIRQTLDLFCAGLWDYWVSADSPEIMTGEDTAPPSFRLYPYIIEGGGTILFSPPGRGKSYIALLWAQSVNAGVSKFWKVTKQPVLFINLERSGQSIKRRLAAVNRALNLSSDYPLLVYNKRGQPLSALAPNIAKAVQQHGIKLIVLDSISRAGYGDLTENRPVNLIIDTLSNLCPTWVALGHTPRADESHVFGGIMFDAGADVVVQLSSEPEERRLGIRLEIVKSNDLPAVPSHTWSLNFEEWSLSSVEEAKPFEFAELETKRKPKLLSAIIDFILNQDTSDASATMIANELDFNRVNVSNLLNKSGKFVKTRKVKQSQYYGVKDV